MAEKPKPRVVIVGGGFAGVAAAKALRGCDADVTLIDRRNHHIFQPLLYQVATALLAPSDVATPIRQLASTLLVIDPEFANPYLPSRQHQTHALRLHARYPVQPHAVKMLVGQD